MIHSTLAGHPTLDLPLSTVQPYALRLSLLLDGLGLAKDQLVARREVARGLLRVLLLVGSAETE